MQEFHAFSIVLIIKDDIELIDCSLRSFERLDYPRDKFEVIVVDDGSKIPVESKINRKFNYNLRFHYIKRTESSSRSAARNVGAKLSKFDNLVFVDGDHFVSPDLLKNYCKYFRARPNRLVVLGVRKHIQDRDRNKVLRHMRQGEPIPESLEKGFTDDERIRLQEYSGRTFNTLIGRWHLFWSCNFCIARNLFDSIGGFDEDFVSWGFEDVELGYRLYINNHEYDLISNYAYHFLPLNPVTPQKYLNWLENIQVFYLKYRDERILMQFALEDVFLSVANLLPEMEPVDWLEKFLRFNDRLEVLSNIKSSVHRR